MSKQFEDYIFPITTYFCNTCCKSESQDYSCAVYGCQAPDYPVCANCYWICASITAPIECVLSPFTMIYHCIKGNICCKKTIKQEVKVIPKKLRRKDL